MSSDFAVWRIPIREMYRRQNEQKLPALALRTFQHVVEVASLESRPEPGDQHLNVHWLVEIAGRRVAAIEVQPVHTE